MITIRITRGQLMALWAIVWGSKAGGRDKLLATLDATIDALPPREGRVLLRTSLLPAVPRARNHPRKPRYHPREPRTKGSIMTDHYSRAREYASNGSPDAGLNRLDLRALLDAADERDRIKAELGDPSRHYIMDGCLVIDTGRHTCGTGPGGHYGAHEPGCGLEQALQLDNLQGWPGDERDRLRAAVRQIADACHWSHDPSGDPEALVAHIGQLRQIAEDASDERDRLAGVLAATPVTRSAAAYGWDRAIASLRYEDGTSVEIVTQSNPFALRPTDA